MAGGGLNLGENLPDAGGLSCPRRATDDGIDGASSLQGGPGCLGELSELYVTVVDGVGCVVEFKDVKVFEECLVGHEKFLWHEKGVGVSDIIGEGLGV